jgi:hypothetical protein
MAFWQLHGGVKLGYCISNRRNKSECVGEALPQMKNPYEVLRIKEQEMIRVRKELDALRLAARLLDAEDSTAAKGNGKPELSRVVEMP